MARLRGRPLASYNQAEFEALEASVEAAALAAHLAEFYDDEPDDDGRAEW